MKFASIPPEAREALARALGYWSRHWDFECPVLFGIELHELNDVRSHWPSIPKGSEHQASLALLGSLRELLYGASAVPRLRVPEVIGLTYERADALCREVHTIVAPYL